jgi:hypothetical protein
MILIFGETTCVSAKDIPFPEDPAIETFRPASTCAQSTSFGRGQSIEEVTPGMVAMAAIIVSLHI